jgi:hypothetical protein
MKTGILIFFLFTSSFLFAQKDEEEKGGFKQERIFIGSSLNLAFSSGVFQIGANPEVGYSINNFLDAGINFNINYTSFKYPYYSDQIFNYGIGSVIRIWPVNFLFISAVPEYNWINVTRKYVDNITPDQKDKFNAGSLLLGAGYGKRIVGQMYSYFALMFDALHDQYSPYRDVQGRAIPIIKAGFAIYLKPKYQR